MREHFAPLVRQSRSFHAPPSDATLAPVCARVCSAPSPYDALPYDAPPFDAPPLSLCSHKLSLVALTLLPFFPSSLLPPPPLAIQETSALKGKGLFEGFDWLVTCIKGAQEGGT